MAKVEKMYDDVEVGRILKYSEVGGGHAEARHSMGGSGRSRATIDDAGLAARNIAEASAYASGNQIPATVACLNCAEGQAGLRELDGGAKRVTLKIYFAGLDPAPKPPWPFKMRVAQAQAGGGYTFSDAEPSHGIVVTEKTSEGLKIVTSYPSRTSPGALGNASGRETKWK